MWHSYKWVKGSFCPCDAAGMCVVTGYVVRHCWITGACPAHAILRVQILSFRHTKFSKRNRLGSQQPPLRGRCPPYRRSWIHHCRGLLHVTPILVACYLSLDTFHVETWRQHTSPPYHPLTPPPLPIPTTLSTTTPIPPYPLPHPTTHTTPYPSHTSATPTTPYPSEPLHTHPIPLPPLHTPPLHSSPISTFPYILSQ